MDVYCHYTIPARLLDNNSESVRQLQLQSEKKHLLTMLGPSQEGLAENGEESTVGIGS